MNRSHSNYLPLITERKNDYNHYTLNGNVGNMLLSLNKISLGIRNAPNPQNTELIVNSSYHGASYSISSITLIKIFIYYNNCDNIS